MTIDKAIDLLRKEHACAESLPYVHKPVAWALYQVWKKADQEKERPSAADPGNVEPCSDCAINIRCGIGGDAKCFVCKYGCGDADMKVTK